MQPTFWEQRWRSGQIGFHQPDVHAGLLRHWSSLNVPADGHVLVPLCGKSVDLLWLRQRRHVVCGVELSEIATEAFFMESGLLARRRPIAAFDRYDADGLILYRGDFLALTPDLLGKVAAVYDRASLVAWPPELREAYVAHLTSLIPAGSVTLLITLEYPQQEMSGPPFSVDRAEVQRLYGANYAIQELERRDVLPEEPRMQSRGVSELFEVSYRLTRLA